MIHTISREHGELEWEWNSGRAVEMKNIDVDAEHRRQGIGRSLFEELERTVAEQEGLSVYGFTAGDNAVAQAFYKALGYHLIWIPEHYGRGRQAYLFHKVLG